MHYHDARPGDLTFDNKKQVILAPARLQATLVFDTPLDFLIIDTIPQYLKTDIFVQDIHIRSEHVQLACHHLDLLKTHMWFLMRVPLKGHTIV